MGIARTNPCHVGRVVIGATTGEEGEESGSEDPFGALCRAYDVSCVLSLFSATIGKVKHASWRRANNTHGKRFPLPYSVVYVRDMIVTCKRNIGI